MNVIDMIRKNDKAFTFAPMSQAYIHQAEKELNVSFSNEYSSYLSEFGVAIFDGHELTGLCDGKRLDVIQITQDERKRNEFIPDTWYVVECLDIDGIIIWQNSNGTVYAATPNSKAKKIADSLSEYISK